MVILSFIFSHKQATGGQTESQEIKNLAIFKIQFHLNFSSHR